MPLNLGVTDAKSLFCSQTYCPYDLELNVIGMLNMLVSSLTYTNISIETLK